jgi:hypothetical protein
MPAGVAGFVLSSVSGQRAILDGSSDQDGETPEVVCSKVLGTH